MSGPIEQPLHRPSGLLDGGGVFGAADLPAGGGTSSWDSTSSGRLGVEQRLAMPTLSSHGDRQPHQKIPAPH